MDGYFVLDARGEPLEEKDFTTWTRWFEQADRSVSRTDVVPQVTVLTSFSGFDPHANGGTPRLFETRVLGGVLDGEEARHASKAEALGPMPGSSPGAGSAPRRTGESKRRTSTSCRFRLSPALPSTPPRLSADSQFERQL